MKKYQIIKTGSSRSILLQTGKKKSGSNAFKNLMKNNLTKNPVTNQVFNQMWP